MSEVPPAPMQPSAPVVTTRSRRRLIIGIGAGLVAVAVAAIGIPLTLSALNANSLMPYTSDAEGYAVTAPGEPTQEHITVVLPLALPATATRWTDGELYYSVSSADGDSLPPTPVWRGQFLHDVLVGALREAPGVSSASLETSAVTDAFLTQPEEITVSGDPAFRFTLAVDGAPAPFQVVFAGHGSMLYMLVFSDSADSRDEDFLDSFTFVD